MSDCSTNEVVLFHRLSPLVAAAAVALYADKAHAAPVGTIDVIASPTEVAPGGSTNLTIVVRDTDGNGQAGTSLNLMANAGSATTIQDYGNGTYSTVYTTAPNATGSVTLVVASADGSVRTPVELSINPALEATVAVPETPVAQTAPPAETTTKAPREPREKRERADSGDSSTARIRVGVGGGSYSYSQVRTPDTESPLWADNVYLGGENGAAGPAHPLTFEGRATVWLPQYNWIGLDGHIRYGSHKVEWPGASEPIPDLVPHGGVNLALRYPFATNAGQMHIGAKVGWLYGEFITFQEGENNNQLDYPNLAVHSLGTGAEFGAEFEGATSGYLNASFLAGWRGGSPYSLNFSLDAGINTGSAVGLGASVQFSQRTIEIVSADDATATLGTLSDTTIVAVVGPTLEF